MVRQLCTAGFGSTSSTDHTVCTCKSAPCMRSLDQQAILAITLAVIFMINPTGLLSRVRSWVQTDSFLLAAYSLKISTLDFKVGLLSHGIPQ